MTKKEAREILTSMTKETVPRHARSVELVMEAMVSI